jgi:RNA polymerase sigma-70 factor (ECF subfamily)
MHAPSQVHGVALRNTSRIKALVELSNKGDRRAQEKLYKVMFPYAMRVASLHARCRDTAQEMVNTALCKAFRYLGTYDGRRPFPSWLRRIVLNTCIDHFQKERALKVECHALLEEIPGGSMIAEQQTLNEVNELMHHVENLPPGYRKVLWMYVVEGFTHREIAERLRISVGTSKSNLHKARSLLVRTIRGTCPVIKKH